MERQIAEMRQALQTKQEQLDRLTLESQGAQCAVQAAQAEAAAASAAAAAAIAEKNAQTAAANSCLEERDEQIAQLQFQLNEARQNAQYIATGAQTPVEKILKQLQTPQIIRDVPSFDGDTNMVGDFCNMIDNILTICEEARGTPQYTGWLWSIKKKITGEASRVLGLYGNPNNWEEIKQILVTHFCDKRDEVTLTRDLYGLTQIGKLEEFYSSVCHIVSELTNRLELNPVDPAVKASKLTLYQEMGLKVFVGGLKEPLGPIIRAQAPRTLREALRLCYEESNYRQSLSGHHSKTPINPPRPPKPIYQFPTPYLRPI